MKAIRLILPPVFLFLFFFYPPLCFAQSPVGTIEFYSGTTIPDGRLRANGDCLSSSTYSDLYNVITTTFGSCGANTFRLPNLKGRIPLSIGDGSFATLGATGGEVSHTLSIPEMPSHVHPPLSRNYFLNYSVGGSTNIATSGGSLIIADNGTTGFTGNGQPHNNMQPYIILNGLIVYTSSLSVSGGGSMYPTDWIITPTISSTNLITITTIQSGSHFISTGYIYFNPFTGFEPIRTFAALLMLLFVGVALQKPTSFIILWIGLMVTGVFSYNIPAYWTWTLVAVGAAFIMYKFFKNAKKV